MICCFPSLLQAGVQQGADAAAPQQPQQQIVTPFARASVHRAVGNSGAAEDERVRCSEGPAACPAHLPPHLHASPPHSGRAPACAPILPPTHAPRLILPGCAPPSPHASFSHSCASPLPPPAVP